MDAVTPPASEGDRLLHEDEIRSVEGMSVLGV